MNNYIALCKVCGAGSDFYKSVSHTCKACWKIKVLAWDLAIDPATGLTNRQLSWRRRRHLRKPQMKAYRATARQEALAHYSNNDIRCVCCGEREHMFLALDHITPVGRGIRGKTKDGSPRGGASLAVCLRLHDYPPGFQVLCHNCNLGRSINGGVCPHVTA